MVQGPFTYEALPPSDISFVPLKQSRAYNAAELMEVGITLPHVITLPCTLYIKYMCLLCDQAAGPASLCSGVSQQELLCPCSTT